ncbi:hypothetical protein GH714_028740 [Hevea brasiliensis]|uniref:non-specific serine/threonine protein kinase n=1 Tax=Hevea brasiliensis TaxID=3981 RepID=A0A6A6NJS6_HEVBR|nr:hypothetical protein GH714_028740 [Hevea brasiliensis]
MLSGELDKKLLVPCMTFFDVSQNLMSGSIHRFNYNVCPYVPFSNSDPGEACVPSCGYTSFLKYKTDLATHLPFSVANLAMIHNFGGKNFTGQICWLQVAAERLGEQTDYAFLASGNKLTESCPESLFGKCGQIPSGFNNVRSLSSNDPADPLRMTKSNRDQQSNATSQSEAKTESKGFQPIEISCIASASAVVSVLIVLVILLFYARKWVPDVRVQVSKRKEITVFVNIGVPLLYENMVESTGNFNASNCIGNGGFGATYKAEISPGTLVAINKLAIGRFQGVQQFHAEIKALGRAQHPNLVTLIGYLASETEMFLIYNYLPGGNLEDFIKERSHRVVSWMVLHKIALDIASALAYLYHQCAPHVLHRDVKSGNVLLDNDLNAYLPDFGLSRLLGTSETHKADVYGYGVVLLELMPDEKALDPSFSSYEDGFNIVSWACMLLRNGQVNDVFNAVLWDSAPRDDLMEMLILAVRCTVETLTTRPN